MLKWCMTTPLECTIIIVHVHGCDAGRNTALCYAPICKESSGDLDVTTEKNSLEIA